MMLPNYVCLAVSALVLVTEAQVDKCPGDCLASQNCTLPECHCSDVINKEYPNNMKDKPQLVLLTFNDALRKDDYENYLSKIFSRLNPNGCNFGTTMFMTHMYTDYSVAHDYWTQRQEIALNSMTHKSGTDYWKNMNQTMWEGEIIGLKKTFSHFANIPEDDIRGMRAPFLQVGGDNQYQMIQDGGLEYDCSMPCISHMKTGLFPYTLDYHTDANCDIKPCPEECHPGVWTVPMNDWEDNSGSACAMLDTCPNRPENKEEMVKMMNKNFYTLYSGDRAPFGMFAHIGTFQGFPYIWEAYNEFLDAVLENHKDVYFVTIHQLIEWMKAPCTAEEAKTYEPFQTQCNPVPRDCQQQTCKLYHETEWTNMTMYMSQCQNCPKTYPWLFNPLGE